MLLTGRPLTKILGCFACGRVVFGLDGLGSTAFAYYFRGVNDMKTEFEKFKDLVKVIVSVPKPKAKKKKRGKAIKKRRLVVSTI